MMKSDYMYESLELETVSTHCEDSPIGNVLENKLTQDDADNVYACAYELYGKGRLDDAENLFRLLFMYDCKNIDYVIGLGAVFQLKEKYSAACGMYSLAYAMDSSQIQCIFYAAQCHMAMKNYNLAANFFHFVSEEATDEKMKNQATDYYHFIQNLLTEQSETVAE
ncbi:CesD/SycD/LcrH family type III secretion system chaperone [Escherichia coli]|uniref:tetratricopeptide repeat protein n=1 Tax=Escherichia coli TaxID=562 RepID=UPI000BAE86BD|nr:tetratricopeptide repeat protein [Escherichia coli]EAC1403641.1 CesD/SycD/LcrH family type III secretion system chaperone [Escherichia coli]EEW6031441.1 CesD/SycD/LcrH family type III secretion system chaperone [Escherichia coli]EFN9260365.1 CesD/SycD/LcrH family type III secretion system chaperone [Escherichia coli]EGK3604193.1 tetratricopeptide repeat protein [Escherichia coli]EHK4147990.1 tetratricopeptide repeat protein [Escherichia coli]